MDHVAFAAHAQLLHHPPGILVARIGHGPDASGFEAPKVFDQAYDGFLAVALAMEAAVEMETDFGLALHFVVHPEGDVPDDLAAVPELRGEFIPYAHRSRRHRGLDAYILRCLLEIVGLPEFVFGHFGIRKDFKCIDEIPGSESTHDQPGSFENRVEARQSPGQYQGSSCRRGGFKGKVLLFRRLGAWLRG